MALPPPTSPFLGPPHLQPLDAKEQLFVEEYLKLLNPYKAARAAGFGDGYSSTAYRWVEAGEGSDPEDRPHVGHAIQLELARRTEANSLTADRVFRETARLAFSNLKNIYDEDGNLLPIRQLPDDVAAALSSIEVEERGGQDDRHTLRKIRMYDKLGALNLAARLLKLVEKGQEDTPPPEPPAMRVTLKPPVGVRVPAAFRSMVDAG